MSPDAMPVSLAMTDRARERQTPDRVPVGDRSQQQQRRGRGYGPPGVSPWLNPGVSTAAR